MLQLYDSLMHSYVQVLSRKERVAASLQAYVTQHIPWTHAIPQDNLSLNP